MDRNTWINITSLFLTIFFGLVGWIKMENISKMLSDLNPWRIAFFGFLIIFLGSLFITIQDKYKEFKKDYKKTRGLVYQLFAESEGKRLGKVVEGAIHKGFEEAKKDLSKER